MTDRKKYKKLDDPGFVGMQDRRSASQIKKDIELTIQLVKRRKKVYGNRKKVVADK